MYPWVVITDKKHFEFHIIISYVMNDCKRHGSIQLVVYILCKKDNGIIVENTIIKDLGDSIDLLIESMTFIFIQHIFGM